MRKFKLSQTELVMCLQFIGLCFFNISESEQSSMHSFLPLAMYTSGRMHNADVNPSCLSLLFSHWIPLTTLLTVKRLLNIISRSNFLWIMRLYLFCQGRKILRISDWRDANHSYVFTMGHLITRMLFDRLPNSSQKNVWMKNKIGTRWPLEVPSNLFYDSWSYYFMG